MFKGIRNLPTGTTAGLILNTFSIQILDNLIAGEEYGFLYLFHTTKCAVHDLR